MKNKVFHELKENMGCYVSGEHLSEMLGVSRTAVWKHINELKKEGCTIDSSSKKGYRLLNIPDILNSFELGYNLKTSILGSEILCFDTVDSTNNYAKKIAHEGCKDGTTVIADCQTNGRGRLGRTWSSLDKKGLWMSVVLKPQIPPEDVQIMTIGASAAVVAAIREATGIQTGIKWPNDIIYDGKKVCGILTEMSTEMEQVNFLIIGIGLNINQGPEDFPEDIKNKAVSLSMIRNRNLEDINVSFGRSEIIRKLLCELDRIYSKISSGLSAEIIREWKQNSLTLGKQVKFSLRDIEYTGSAIDITEGGRLVVHCEDGITREISSGEVSVRGILGYA